MKLLEKRSDVAHHVQRVETIGVDIAGGSFTDVALGLLKQQRHAVTLQQDTRRRALQDLRLPETELLDVPGQRCGQVVHQQTGAGAVRDVFADLNSVAERIRDEDPTHAGDLRIDFAAELLVHRFEVIRPKSGVRLESRLEIRLHPDVKLHTASPKPTAAARPQLLRLGDFAQPKQVPVKRARLILAPRGHRDLQMVQSVDQHALQLDHSRILGTDMGFQCGIVGLPNVGKSTIFNAITKSANAQAANFPFCTIEPNVGVVPVPDDRVVTLANLVHPKKVVYTSMNFVDIAGLVRGASKGEGLGNKFLSHIREVDAVAHVVRCFEDDDVVHVDGKIDPISDIETIDAELGLKDIETVGMVRHRDDTAARGNDKVAKAALPMYDELLEHLNEGKPARMYKPASEALEKAFRSLYLLTAKPVLYVANVSEDQLPDGGPHVDTVRARAAEEGAEVVVISGQIEAELSEMSEEEGAEFLADLGLKEAGLNQLIRKGYRLLGLMTYLTAGPKEVHAWTIPTGTKAPGAAGVIHTDFEHGFIRVETISFKDFVECGSEQKAKEAGKMRVEGKEYVVQDGDVMHFLFNV
jgi:GTP-binding protein YchF